MKISLYIFLIVTFLSALGSIFLEWLFGLEYIYGFMFLYSGISFGISTYHINVLYDEIDRLKDNQEYMEERFNRFL